MIEPRKGAKTVKFVDEYCQWYRKLFSDVRSFEAFKYLHIGCISELKRKTLPEIAKVTGLDNQQGLHHFLTTSPWNVEELRAMRLKLILQVIKDRPIILIIDETGDKKKGSKTDYCDLNDIFAKRSRNTSEALRTRYTSYLRYEL